MWFETLHFVLSGNPATAVNNLATVVYCKSQTLLKQGYCHYSTQQITEDLKTWSRMWVVTILRNEALEASASAPSLVSKLADELCEYMEVSSLITKPPPPSSPVVSCACVHLQRGPGSHIYYIYAWINALIIKHRTEPINFHRSIGSSREKVWMGGGRPLWCLL